MVCHCCYLQAGLCSRETCGKLKEASGSPEVVNEKHPDKLSLALEPVCAAIYCQTISAQHVSESYQLVVDIGGGTVDISAHRVSSTPDRHLEVIHLLTTDNCGGSRVNKEFENFLEELVKDKGFSRYLETGDPLTNAKRSAELNELVNKTFEEQKVMFGKRSEVASKPGSLRLPLTGTFFDVYKCDIDRGIKRMQDSQLKRNRQDLRIEYSKMADFFQPVVKEIPDLIVKCMGKMFENTDEEKIKFDIVEIKFDTIYLIGGFGGSRFIYDKVTPYFGYKCIIPEEHDFAVVRGAIYFRQYPKFRYSSYPTCIPHCTNT